MYFINLPKHPGKCLKHDRTLKNEHTRWELSKSQILHRPCSHKRFLRIIENMGQCIHTDVKVGDINSHGLLTHSRLVCVSRRLKVEMNNRINKNVVTLKGIDSTGYDINQKGW